LGTTTSNICVPGGTAVVCAIFCGAALGGDEAVSSGAVWTPSLLPSTDVAVVNDSTVLALLALGCGSLAVVGVAVSAPVFATCTALFRILAALVSVSKGVLSFSKGVEGTAAEDVSVAGE